MSGMFPGGNTEKSMAHPNSPIGKGRPKGAKNLVVRARAAKLIPFIEESGFLPALVMHHNMVEAHTEAENRIEMLYEILDKLRSEVSSIRHLADESEDPDVVTRQEELRQQVSMLGDAIADLRATYSARIMSQKCAEGLAPYVHNRLPAATAGAGSVRGARTSVRIHVVRPGDPPLVPQQPETPAPDDDEIMEAAE